MADDIDKLRFELEIKQLFKELSADIEKIRDAVKSSHNSKSDEINKLRETIEKIKGDLDKAQKSSPEKDHDTQKKELEPIRKDIDKLNAELEKLRKPPSDNDNSDKKDDPSMKSELENLRKIMENIQDSKMRDSLEQTKKAVEASQNKIVEVLEKIQKEIEKKPAAPPAGPAGPSPDIQAIKASVDEIKKAMEGNQNNKLAEAVEKLKEAVEKKPPPPGPSGPSPDIQALRESVEQIKKAVDAAHIEPIKTMSIISLVICVLTLFGLIWGIAMSYSINRNMEDMRDDFFPRKWKKSSLFEPSEKPKKASVEKKDISLIDVKNSESVHVLSGQVVIRLVKIKDKSVNLELTLPNMKVYSMEDMKVGTRTRFECDSETYFLDLVKISNDSAKLKIYKRA